MEYGFDVFDTYDVENGKLKVPEASSEHTLVSDEADSVITLASAFGNELIPLTVQARERGIDIRDRQELGRYFNGLGEPSWARYVGREMEQAQYDELIRLAMEEL